MSTSEDWETITPHRNYTRSQLRTKAAPDSLSKRGALDEYLWTHHDAKHTGPYVECLQCTHVHVMLQEHPRFNPF